MTDTFAVCTISSLTDPSTALLMPLRPREPTTRLSACLLSAKCVIVEPTCAPDNTFNELDEHERFDSRHFARYVSKMAVLEGTAL